MTYKIGECYTVYLCYYQTKLIQRNGVRVFLPQHQTCRFSSDFVCQ